jgi:Tfp pilus assembly protein PilE
MNRYKVKAFTILEVTITMLVTALLVAITYASYSIVMKSYRSFTNKNDDMAVLFTLDHLLKRDFDQAETIRKDTNGIMLTNNFKVVKYIVTPDFIVRHAIRIDTFKIQTQGWITSFENAPINELQPIAEQNRIDEFRFNLAYQNEIIPYHYRKLYSSENLIQRNPNAIN